jgi:hypothetical protein
MMLIIFMRTKEAYPGDKGHSGENGEKEDARGNAARW